LLKALIKKLNRAAKKKGIRIKQSYKRVSQLLLIKALRYSNARQFNRMKRCIKRLSTIAGRLQRDIARKISKHQGLIEFFAPLFEQAHKVRYQSLRQVSMSTAFMNLMCGASLKAKLIRSMSLATKCHLPLPTRALLSLAATSLKEILTMPTLWHK
jgi:hypothetical protein